MTGPTSPCPCSGTPCPEPITNLPGLDRIAYRATDFSALRAALLRARPGERWLADWRPAPGDLGLQVLEWWAYLGDILTFYNERIANEGYLGTATLPDSLAGLVDLIGYRPAPGVAATGHVAAVRTTSHPAEPLVVPAGMPLASAATPGVPAQTFEVDATTSHTGPTDVPVTPYPDPALVQDPSGTGPVSVLLAGKVSGLRVGDPVLLVGRVSGVQLADQLLDLPGAWQGVIDNWCWTTVADLTPVTDANTGHADTAVSFPTSARWGTSGSPLGGSPQSVLSYQLLRPTRSTTLWARQVPTGKQVVEQGTCGPVAHLNDAVRSMGPGDLVLFDGGGLQPTCLQVVLGAPESTWTLPAPGPSGSSGGTASPGALVYPHTALLLFGPQGDEDTVLAYTEPDAVAVRHGWKPVGQVVAAPAGQIAALPVTVSAPATLAPPDTTVPALLVDASGTGVAVDVTAGGAAPAVPQPAGTVELTLSSPSAAATTLDRPLSAPLRLQFGLVPVSRGTTVPAEVLGSGDATRVNQSFTLQKGPLTYLADGATVVAALTVYVDGTAWTEVRSFYEQPPAAAVYVVTLDPAGTATVTFGDGVNGARLPTGAGNVTARYRYGSGAASPPAGRLTTILRPQVNLASVANPVAVSGGADPQAPGDVRRNAPASVFTFGRAVSADDYRVVAALAPGVSRAQSVWGFDARSQRATVTIYVAGTDATGASALAARDAAQAALAGAADPNRPVTVLAANPVPLAVAATLVVAADAIVGDVRARALAALADPAAGPFSPAACPIGSRLYRSRLDAALSVPGVVAVTDLSATNPGWCLIGPFVLGEVLDPGTGAYFTLGDTSQVTAVRATAARGGGR